MDSHDQEFLTGLRWNETAPPLKVMAAEIIGRVKERLGGNLPLTLKGVRGGLIHFFASNVIRERLLAEISQGPITSQFLDSLVVQLSSPKSQLSQNVLQEAGNSLNVLQEAGNSLLNRFWQDVVVSDQEETILLNAHVNRLTGNPDAYEWWTMEAVAAARREGRANSYESEVEVGLEEIQIIQRLRIFAEAMQQKAGVVVLDASVVSKRVGLEELMARLPGELRRRMIVYEGTGEGDSFAGKELPAQNGIPIVKGSLVDLAVALVGLEEADRVAYMGDPEDAVRLGRLLPQSIHVNPIDPKAGLEEILRAIGVLPDVLKEMNASGLEEQLERLTRSRAA